MNSALLAFRALAGASRTLPPEAMARAASAAAFALPRLSASRRLMAERNLARAFGRTLDSDELERAVATVFATYTRYWTDSFRLPELTVDELDEGFSYHGFRHIEDGVAAGRGTILVLPHLGGWEWAGSWLARIPKYNVTAVVEPLENDELREWMQSWRESTGLDVLPLGKGLPGELLRRLRDNHVVALVSDRNLGEGGFEVDFFGETTELPGGAATLALRSGAAIVPVAVYHRGPHSHAIVEPPIAAERLGRLRDDVGRITQDIASVLEMQIRREPSQWLLLQPNWPSDHVALRALD